MQRVNLWFDNKGVIHESLDENGRYVLHSEAQAEIAEKDQQVSELEKQTDYLLSIVKLAYRKHHLNDDSIGWNEFDDNLLEALCNTMGEDGYDKWIKEVTK